MPRPRHRVRLEGGLKLDLNRLIRQNLVRPGAAWGSTIHWSERISGREVAAGRVSADMTDDRRGWFRLQLGDLDQRIDLVAAPRHFGGRQWYFVCPRTAQRVSVLWKPPGAQSFARVLASLPRPPRPCAFDRWPHLSPSPRRVSAGNGFQVSGGVRARHAPERAVRSDRPGGHGGLIPSRSKGS